MEKVYQVFVSSTYADLADERRRVSETLAKAGHIPAGMELFPATDQQQLDFIKRVIDRCDYYVVIVGGRYGSLADDSVSFTEKEYEYAVSKRIPILALLHGRPDKIEVGKTDQDHDQALRLQAFRERLAKERIVDFWNEAQELCTKVVIAVAQAISLSPGVGWIRADRAIARKVYTTQKVGLETTNLLKRSHDLRFTAAKLEDHYQEALAATADQFQKDGRAAEQYFERLYGDQKFLRHSFFQTRFRDPKIPTGVRDKLALIAAHRSLPASSLPNLIFEQIMNADSIPRFSAKHDGFYRYWRYYPTETRLTPVRWGVVELRTDGSTGTKFYHWSHDWITSHELRTKDHPVDWKRFTSPEESGYGFFTYRRMFFLGFRTGNIQLLISSLPDANLTEAVMNGIVLTTRKGSGGVFSAAFVMVHEKNPMALQSISHASFNKLAKIRVDHEMYLIHD